MSYFARLMQKLVFSDETVTGEPAHKPSRYSRMWRNTVITVAAVSIIPLVVMTIVNYVLYRRSFNEELTQPTHRIVAISTRSVEFFLEERIAAAEYVLSRESMDDLYDQEKLGAIFRRIRNAFGGIVDVGMITAEGKMTSYAGPYDLLGKDYRDQDWFNKVLIRDVYVSEVFLGHREIPHFIIAVRREDEQGRTAIFRLTIDTEVLYKRIQVSGLRRNSDAFIVSRDSGVLQTQSRLIGPPLTTFPAAVPPYQEGPAIVPDVTIGNQQYYIGYSYIADSPFVFVTLVNKRDLTRGWLAYQGEILLFLLLSAVLILVMIMGITSNWVARIRSADLRREAMLHNIEHTSKMASIGRLAAGVAHEVNNPLAIINEKAGLIKDILERSRDQADPAKLEKQVDAILTSVKRCSDITHRLLGFARHMDLRIEPVAVDALIRDVLGFLDKEAKFRNIVVEMNVSDTLPTIYSDKGQLQQLFLNIINNAFDAMHADGRLDIGVRDVPPDHVEVVIADSGVGIPKEDLERIYEPFFTTKEVKGTGLGLSISYGIVRKLRGTINVESELGKGTSFTITLPIRMPKPPTE